VQAGCRVRCRVWRRWVCGRPFRRGRRSGRARTGVAATELALL